MPLCQDVPIWTSLAYSLACDSYRAGDEPQALSKNGERSVTVCCSSDRFGIISWPLENDCVATFSPFLFRFCIIFYVPLFFFATFLQSIGFFDALSRRLSTRGKVYLSGTFAYLFPSFLCSWFMLSTRARRARWTISRPSTNSKSEKSKFIDRWREPVGATLEGDEEKFHSPCR